VVPKILDFGVSKILEDEVNNALTVAGTVLGSPLYMSPEQASGSSNIDGRTDIFAFGSILFEALCGKRAFDAHNFNALIVTIATQQPLKIDDVAPHIPEPLKAIVRECMVTDRTKRVASFDKVAEKLARALPELESCTLRLPSPYSAAPPSDPDATNALPVIPSDRQPGALAPASLANTVPPRSGNSPPGAFVSPWGAPPLIAKLPGPPWALAVGAGGALLALLIVVILIVSVSKGTGAQRAAAAQASTMATSRASTSTSAGPGAEPPEVNVDSLPVAPKGAGKSTGKLAVSSGPGVCIVSIDGVPQGQSPTMPLALPPGVHTVECRPAAGKVRTANVTVQDGVTERYKFVLDDTN
jgi:serine/threonine-protein kinase